MSVSFHTPLPKDIMFYWRTPNKQLCSAVVKGTEDIVEAQKLVMQHLHDTLEVYMLPVLALIKGGKA